MVNACCCSIKNREGYLKLVDNHTKSRYKEARKHVLLPPRVENRFQNVPVLSRKRFRKYRDRAKEEAKFYSEQKKR